MPLEANSTKRPAQPDILESSVYQRKRYQGKDSKLLLSIDLGTTFSAASFCILAPRSLPTLEAVRCFRISAESDFKVPTVLYYDYAGKAHIWGAQTTDEDYIAEAQRKGLIKVEWFKLALRPPYLSSSDVSPSVADITHTNLPTLPIFIPIEKAYTDFLRFILEHIEEFFCKHHASGKDIWDQLFPTAEVILTIPNGWEIKQQSQVREAAVAAGFVGKIGDARNLEEGMQRIHFLSEAEAAMIYAMDSGYINSWIQPGKDILLCDAGGGTIDLTAYTITRKQPLQVKERLASQCIVAGAVFINQQARRHLSERLQGTFWDIPWKIDDLVMFFERTTKKTFSHLNKYYGLGRAGSENIPEAGVSNGRFYIRGTQVARFFEPTLNAIKAGIEHAYNQSGGTIKNVVMVGGLMNSSHAFSQLRAWGHDKGIQFSKPDGTMAKSVSHGALLWYLTKPVKSHIAKFHYGTDICPP
ncbi:hypothetical protein P691DRAFT_681457, partial [Macrolepiota fuliginosa MF-IS2]